MMTTPIVLLTTLSTLTPATPAHRAAWTAPSRRTATVAARQEYPPRLGIRMLPDGGRVRVQGRANDEEASRRLRQHLQALTRAFAMGDFEAIPYTPLRGSPGVIVLEMNHALVRVSFTPLPGGGEIRMTTRDTETLTALHEFLAWESRAPDARRWIPWLSLPGLPAAPVVATSQRS